MKFYGDLDIGENLVRNVVINDDGAFQSAPKVGRLTFNGKRLYICVEIVNSKPIWIPLTNEITTKTIRADVAATTWTLTHNLNSATPVIQIYDTSSNQVIPDSIQIVTANEATVTFSSAMAGFAVIVIGSEEGSTKPNTIFTQPVTTPTTSLSVNHNLGFYPVIAAYDTNGYLIMPSVIIQQNLFSTDITFEVPFTGQIRLS
jgi:hypothetical protein